MIPRVVAAWARDPSGTAGRAGQSVLNPPITLSQPFTISRPKLYKPFRVSLGPLSSLHFHS